MMFVLTVFIFESRQLFRSRFLLSLFAFVFLAGLYGLLNGHALISRQEAGIDSIGVVQDTQRRMLIARFHEDTATAQGKQLRQQAGVPQVVEFRDPPYAVFPPSGLSRLAIGLRDIHPFYDLISSKENKTDSPATDFSNAEQLAAGSFDLAFVFLYLFPLLVILYCYNCLSGERELQTVSLLVIHTGGLQRFLCWRFVFRYIMVFVLGVLLFLMGGGFSVGEGTRWMALWGGYWLCWFALCWLVMRFDRSSMWNIICLGSIWLFLVWILPATTNSIVDLSRPVPPKSSLLAELREVKEETWTLPVPVLLDSFYHYYPQYAREERDTAAYGNRRFLAFNELLGRRNRRLEQAYEAQLHQRQALHRLLLYMNPVSYVQYHAHRLAGTELTAFENYELQVTEFRRQWQALMREYLVHGRMFNENDISHLPHFSFQCPAERDILYNLLYLVCFSGIIIFPAQFKLK